MDDEVLEELMWSGGLMGGTSYVYPESVFVVRRSLRNEY